MPVPTPIALDFFDFPTVELAQKLLGKYLVHIYKNELYIGKIVETEAYLEADSASHSFGGMTPRNKAMFGLPGHAYIYFTYGKHFCFNVTSNKEGVGEGILIRAVEPITGIEFMMRNRYDSFFFKERITDKQLVNLTNGPAKLVSAFKISKERYYGHNLSQTPLYIAEEISPEFTTNDSKSKIEIQSSPRIGISTAQEEPLRFFIKDNPFVSNS